MAKHFLILVGLIFGFVFMVSTIGPLAPLLPWCNPSMPYLVCKRAIP